MPGHVDQGHGAVRDDADDEGALGQVFEAGDRGPPYPLGRAGALALTEMCTPMNHRGRRRAAGPAFGVRFVRGRWLRR
jgi:hypothetical protein